MPEFYTWAILLINQQDEIGETQLSVFGSRGGQDSPLMHVTLCLIYSLDSNGIFFYMYCVEPGNILDKIGLVARKPVSRLPTKRVSNVSLATETSKKIEISSVASLHMVLS